MLIRYSRPRVKPPGNAVFRVRRDHPLADGLVACIVTGAQFGLGRDLVTGALFSGTNSPAISVTPEGAALDVSSTAHASAESIDQWNVTADITVAWRGVIRSTASAGNLINKIPTGGNGGTNTPFSLEYANGTAARIQFVRSPAGAGPFQFRNWQCGADVISTNTVQTFSASQGGDMSVAPSFYAAGVLVGGTPTNQYSGAGSGAAGGNANPLILGRRPDGAEQHDGQSLIALVAAIQWSAGGHQRFHEDPYSILEEAPRWVFMQNGAPTPLTAEGAFTFADMTIAGEATYTAPSTGVHGVLRRRVRRQLWNDVPVELKPVVALAENYADELAVQRAVDDALARFAAMKAKTSIARRERLVGDLKRAIVAAVEEAAEADDEDALIALL